MFLPSCNTTSASLSLSALDCIWLLRVSINTQQLAVTLFRWAQPRPSGPTALILGDEMKRHKTQR